MVLGVGAILSGAVFQGSEGFPIRRILGEIWLRCVENPTSGKFGPEVGTRLDLFGGPMGVNLHVKRDGRKLNR